MPSARTPKPSRHLLPIVDQEALRFVLRGLVEQEGSQDKAGKLIGLSQGSFSRLMNSERDAISYATYARMLRVLGGQAREFGRAPRPVLEFIADPSEADIERVVCEVIAETGAAGPKDIGRVMKPSLDRLGPAADGKLVSGLVRRLLSARS